MGRFQRDPEAFESGRGPRSIVIFLASPTLRDDSVDRQMESMPMLDFEAIRRHIVLRFPKLSDDPESRQTGFLMRLTQRGLFGRFTRTHAAGRDLNADFLRAEVDV